MIPTSRLSSFLLFLAFLPVVAWGQSVSKPAAKTAAKTTVAPASNKSSGTKTDTKKSVAAPAVKAKDSGKENAVKPVKEAAEPKEKEMTPAQRAQAQKAAKAEKVKRPRILRDADDYYNAKEYFKAITLYKKGFSKAKARPDKAEVAFRLGECYRWTRRYKEANAQYVRAVKIGYKDPSVLLIMADMHKALDEYEEALIAYQDFTKQMPEDPRGPKGAQSCKDALDWKKALTRYQVGNLGSVNSRFHEVGLSFSGKPDTYEELLFTSFREGGLTKRQDGWTGEFFADLYTAQRQAPARKIFRRGPEGAAGYIRVQARLPNFAAEVAEAGAAQKTRMSCSASSATRSAMAAATIKRWNALSAWVGASSSRRST